MGRRKVSLLIQLLFLSFSISNASKVLDEVPIPEDSELDQSHLRRQRILVESDDEDFVASAEGSAEFEEGSTPRVVEHATPTPQEIPKKKTVYYRVLVNFTTSIEYDPQLEDFESETFREVSEGIIDTLESEFYRISGDQSVTVVWIKQEDQNVIVELDVGSDGNTNDEEIRDVVYSVVRSGSIGPYETSVEGFKFRHLGEDVIPVPRQCHTDEFSCGSGECVPYEYRCDLRADCSDMSDEDNCEIIGTVSTPSPIRPRTPAATTTPTFVTARPERRTPRPLITAAPTPTTPDIRRPCPIDKAVCQNGQCIPRDYLCDGERDCTDGSDELDCGTASPCEPNEFKCKNGRCALKLWRCDGDNDCGDRSDEEYCPTKGPGDMCAPEQFVCVSTRLCIPASYQCDEEADCPDRSDEFGCTPPQVITPPEETVMVKRGATVTLTCVAAGVPTPIITWRLNWGHIPVTSRVAMTSQNGQGTLIIRDVKESDQGAYTCEAINAKGMIFAIPDALVILQSNPGICSEGQFNVEGSLRCLPCFCFGHTRNCESTSRYRNQIHLRFTEEDNFMGVNMTVPAQPVTPPLSTSQMIVDPDSGEFQLVDLSRRFLNHDSFWTLPRQFLGNKVDSYGGFLRYKVRYSVARGQAEPEEKSDVIIIGNGRKLIYKTRTPTQPNVINQKAILFTEDNWQHESGTPVTREDLMMTLANLDKIMIRAKYDNKMASVGLSDIVMDTTSVEFTTLGKPQLVEQCRCPLSYKGLSCEICASGFKRVLTGPYLGICDGCNCNGHASSCDKVTGYCLSCQHNTEGSHCDKCKPGYFGNPTRGTANDCMPCPCPFTDSHRRFSDTCFLDTDGRPTCDACSVGYTGRRCETCAAGYEGNPMIPGGKCRPHAGHISNCDSRGTDSTKSYDGLCVCKPNVVGRLCDECSTGSFNLDDSNMDGCLKCFCMGISKQCASSSWHRDQVRAVYDEQERNLFMLTNMAHTQRITEGVQLSAASEITFVNFDTIPRDIYYWVLPDRFKGDKVTSYGGELHYTILHNVSPGSSPITGMPDVILQGNSIFLEHYTAKRPQPGIPSTFSVPFKESAWRRADGQPSTREHLLMALANVNVFMIRASYTEGTTESRISQIHMDVAIPHSTGQEQAVEVEECICPKGYKGSSCQECDFGYTRTAGGLYLGMCERCDCNGHSDCDADTGECLKCQHNTEGLRCERCEPGFYGNARDGTPNDCRPCPCPGTTPSNQFSPTCFLDTDGQATCDQCPNGYEGKNCERCAPGYNGNPIYGQSCITGCKCDWRGSTGGQCDASGQCQCKPNVQGQTCDTCKAGHFYLSAESREGCLPCFCMGVTQQCSSSSYYRKLVGTPFVPPNNFQNFSLVNRQRTTRITSGFTVTVRERQPQLSFGRFGQYTQESYYWQLPEAFQGDKVTSYGGLLRYTLSYDAGFRGSMVPDADVQIIGNDITLVTYHHHRLQPREIQSFEIMFKEQFWKRPDGQQATREHLLMVLADLDEVLIRATYSTDMISASLSDVSMEIAVPFYTNLAQALQVEECRCPPAYHGLSCQDCAPGYTRTGGGLYLGDCKLCECNGHSDTCHPETGLCLNCLHNTAGEFCDQCAPGYYGDATAGTPEDCQPCACPLTVQENQFSLICESSGVGGYRCTACLPGYTGQYCERCAPGYSGNPRIPGQKCHPVDRNPFLVRVIPERTTVEQGSTVILKCQVIGQAPLYYYWSRADGQPLSNRIQLRDQGEELLIQEIKSSDAGIYICTCRNMQSTNSSRVEVVVTVPSFKAITVTVEEPRTQTVRSGVTVNFICTAKSQSPAYTLVWTRQLGGKLPNTAVDFNGILTIRNVRAEDAGVYVCTGSNMFAMDEGTAVLHVPDDIVLHRFYSTETGHSAQPFHAAGYAARNSTSQVHFQAFEILEGYRQSTAPVATIEPPILTVKQGQTVEFRCTATGNPPPTLEWFGGQGNVISPNSVIQGGLLRIVAVERSDEAEYSCKASNSAGHHTDTSILYVQSSGNLPQVQVSPQRIEVPEGDTVRLYCRAGGQPSPMLSWKKHGGELPLQAKIERTDIGTLIIPSITAAQAGIYLCVGTNAAGSSEGRIEVTVFTSEGFVPIIRIQPSPASVTEGEMLELYCHVTGEPRPKITWRKSSGYLTVNHQMQGPVLRIRQATRADAGDYICHAENKLGMQEVAVSVSVTSSVSPRLTAPTVRVHPSSTSATEGEMLELHCQVTGHPQPRITWYRAAGSLTANHQVQGPVLRILHMTPADVGDYICRAENALGMREVKFSVSVTSISSSQETPPIVMVHPSPTSVREGEMLELHCQVTGQPQPRITWYRAAGPLTANHQVQGPVLRLLHVSAADGGDYICRAENIVAMREVKFSVSVTSSSQGTAPAVMVRPSPISLTEGEMLELHCQVTGQPQPRITWYRPAGPLTANHQVQGPMLRILHVSPADAGDYICRAENVYGMREVKFLVTVTSSSPQGTAPTVKIHASPTSIREGEMLELRCQVTGQPEPRVTWYRAAGSLTTNHQVQGPVLRILHMTPADVGDYICRAENVVATREVKFSVSVTSTPFSQEGAPIVRVQPTPTSVTEGQMLELHCQVTGQPEPMITWYKADGYLTANHQVEGPVLRILQVTPDDGGDYICRAENIFGMQQLKFSVSVTSTTFREQLPVINTGPRDVTVIQGGDATFSCQVIKGARPFSIEWKTPNEPQHDNVKISSDGSVMTITRARQRDQGQYKCMAHNRFGLVFSIMTLVVQGPPTVSVSPRGPVRLGVGNSVTLECIGMGEPQPTISWRRINSRQRNNLGKQLLREGNPILTISSARLQDSGTYSCTSSNLFGTAEARVEVIVELSASTPQVPQVTSEEPALTITAGQIATLRCTATGYPTPIIQWSKLRAPLPWQHKIVNGSLVIPHVGLQDSGQYICNASNSAGFNEMFIMLDVETPPYATFDVEAVTVRAGDIIRLHCLSQGTPPIKYEWSKVNGSLPSRAVTRNGFLQINLAVVSDSGMYRCLVKNKVGQSDAIATVNVRSLPAVKVSPQIEVRNVGSTVEFACSVTGHPKPRIEWFKEGGQLPPNHRISKGVLRLENIQDGNEGVYICRASNPFGRVQDSAKLAIQALPIVMINVRASMQMVMIGGSVEFECQAIGDPQPSIRWSKVDGRLSPEVIIKNGMLKIEQAKESDAGRYRCTATNDAGSVKSEVVLYVQTVPMIAPQPELKEVTIGSTAVFPCLASGFPVPEVTWNKLEGELPPGAYAEDNVLTIPSATTEHTGTYVCTATNEQGTETAYAMLKVRERKIPYFTQDPISYITVPTIKDAYHEFEIRITFRSDAADGMIIYNGQKQTTGADFISFTLVGGRPEFRFDVGSGMATIRHPNPISLGEYHTVVLYRNLTQGSLFVDNDPPVNGSSQGNFRGLDLNEELYIGGYPHFDNISKVTGSDRGFMGCIRQLIIQGDEVIFSAPELKARGISNCPTCKDNPCKNEGQCVDSETSSYVCYCRRGYTGSNCEHSQALHCHPEACGSDATCVNRPDGLGYNCRCHLGKRGPKCMDGDLITAPSFRGADSFVAYPPLTNVHNELTIELDFKPRSLTGLMFYTSGKRMKMNDFISVAMLNGHVEFRYDLGSGLAVLQSAKPVALNKWHKLKAHRHNRDGLLTIDSEKEVRNVSPGKSQGLNLRSPMYLGGVPRSEVLPKAVNVSDGIDGCIAEVSINGKKVDLSYTFTDSLNVDQCYDSSPCDRVPCLHGGRCIVTGEYEYQCICTNEYQGENCETFRDTCLQGNPCMNGGTCEKNQCWCPMGYTGLYCELGMSAVTPAPEWHMEGSADSPVQYGAFFHNGGYIVLPKQMFPRSSPTAPETIEMEVRTASLDGVLLWQGVKHGENGKGKDYVALGLQNGHVLFSYQLGSGEANILSEDPINDGEWHRIIAVREGKSGYIQLDGDEIVRGESKGDKVMVNTRGSVYLGGAPDIKLFTGGKFTSGITGCIRKVVLVNKRPDQHQVQPVDLRVHAEGGVNARECPS
ncbi:basement membrane-specific heparan sulfate proteoglycan core protein isoform X2 [Heterodontus francisci]|uniref:basement membrane-specific heparan sulfate proteoglycan core protein isoform X2 n=1 Tax=Heterodontus francisci TaxID=7792 RepID=UPI00355B411B